MESLGRQRDRGWDSSEDAKAFVSGLFQACVSINEVHDNLSVYVSLRQELYDDIPALYEDAQKYRDLRDELEFLCLELATGDIPTNETSSWLAGRDPEDVIEILCQVGFLTAQPVGQRATSQRDERRTFLGAHQVQHLNLAAVQRFGVQPMFGAYLGVRQQNGR